MRPMSQSNKAFCLASLSQWCRQHGIHEIREVLARAAALAAEQDSAESLSDALGIEAVIASKPVKPLPLQQDEPQQDEARPITPPPAKRAVPRREKG